MNAQVTQAVIPAAGLGTRMLPAAKAVPKEMLPILDRPTIQFVVEEAVAGGINDVLLITSPQKQAIIEHFRPARIEHDLLRPLDELIARIKIRQVHQLQQRGLGDAVNQARSHVNGPFLCMLGDTVFSGQILPAQQLVQAYARLGTTIIGLEEVPVEKVSRYGIVSGRSVGDGTIRIEGLVEKPSPDQAPSRLAIAARYVLTPAIFDCLDRTPEGKGGEIQLTDALRLLLEREPIHGVVLSAKRHDVGNPADWLATNLLFAARDSKLWAIVQQTIEPLLRAKKY